MSTVPSPYQAAAVSLLDEVCAARDGESRLAENRPCRMNLSGATLLVDIGRYLSFIAIVRDDDGIC